MFMLSRLSLSLVSRAWNPIGDCAALLDCPRHRFLEPDVLRRGFEDSAPGPAPRGDALGHGLTCIRKPC